MFKFALNAGHGYNTAGKRTLKAIDKNETREYVLNKRICDKVENKLSLYDGIEILRIDDGTELTISQRAKKANKFGADFYLAVHHNAGINGGSGGGIVAYVYLKVDETTKQWQKLLYDKLIEKTGLKGNRASPLNSADFGEVRETAMPAVLLECGFMDSKVDTPIILTDEFAEKAANAITEAIVEKAKLTLKKKPQEPQEKPAPKENPSETAEGIGETEDLNDDNSYRNVIVKILRKILEILTKLFGEKK